MEPSGVVPSVVVIRSLSTHWSGENSSLRNLGYTHCLSPVYQVTQKQPQFSKVTIKVEMSLPEAVLRHLPELVVSDPAESVGVSPSVARLGGPVDLGWLASGPVRHSGDSEKPVLVMLRCWLAANIAATPTSGLPTSTTAAKNII